MRNESAQSSEIVTVSRRCNNCAETIEHLRPNARFCANNNRCKQEYSRNKTAPRPPALAVEMNPGCPPDDGLPGQFRILAVEVRTNAWAARGATWTLTETGDGWELRADDGRTMRPSWPMPYAAQARAWARMALSTPKETP